MIHVILKNGPYHMQQRVLPSATIELVIPELTRNGDVVVKHRYARTTQMNCFNDIVYTYVSGGCLCNPRPARLPAVNAECPLHGVLQEGKE